MAKSNLFYYPYATFSDPQVPLLKCLAMYFDNIFLLEPQKAQNGATGCFNIGYTPPEVSYLKEKKVLNTITPEEVLVKYDNEIENAIEEDMNDEAFVEMCTNESKASGRHIWRIALQKIPSGQRNLIENKPYEDAMRKIMGAIPQKMFPRISVYIEKEGICYVGPNTFDVETQTGGAEYRIVDLPLALGESIMINHALFAGLAYKSATPISDDSFHRSILEYKIARAIKSNKGIREILEDRARTHQLRADAYAYKLLTDKKINLPVLNPSLPLEKIWDYREKHKSLYEKACKDINDLCTKIKSEPLTDKFIKEVDSDLNRLDQTIDDIRRNRNNWIKLNKKDKAFLATGVILGAATAVLSLATGPVTPVAVALAGTQFAGGSFLPFLSNIFDDKDSLNGLRYFFKIKVPKA